MSVIFPHLYEYLFIFHICTCAVLVKNNKYDHNTMAVQLW